LLAAFFAAAFLGAAFLAAAFFGAAFFADTGEREEDEEPEREPDDLDADLDLLFEEELFVALFLLVVFAMVNIFLVYVPLTTKKLMPVIQNQLNTNMKNIFHM
jgi:hypothetical protein